MSNTKYFADLVKVCSVLPALLVMPAMAIVPEGYVESKEQAIGLSTAISGRVFENAYVRSKEGTPVSDQNLSSLYFAHGTQTSKIFNTTFRHNNTEVGGAFAVAGGGSPYWPERLGGNQSEVVVTNSTFSDNSALYDAGAIGNYGFLTIGDGVVFKNNISVNGIETVDYMGGGALGLGSLSMTKIDEDTKFISNYSGTYGGAIATRRSENGDNSIAKLDIKGDFELNEAKYRGGAIYNTFYNGLNAGTGVTVDAEFVKNIAGQYGGAIYNDGTVDKAGNAGGVMTISDSDFEYNVAGIDGGAIYNAGNMTIIDSELVGNIASTSGGAIYNLGDLSITDAEFINNRTIDGLGDGGAIYSNLGSLTLRNTDFRNNGAAVDVEEDLGYGGAIYVQGGTVDIRGTENDLAEFTGNHGLTGGAIYVSKHTTSTTIKNALFKENWASDIGALGIFGKNTKLDNLHFIGNYTTGEFEKSNDGGGALFFGAVSSTDLTGVLSASEFIGNKSASRGGAISTRTFYLGDNRDAYLDISDTNFVGNIATTNGGAIDNFFYHSTKNADAMYVTDAIFDGNHAACGGAVYNHGSTSVQNKYNSELKQVAAIQLNDAIFTGNIASEFGGAIYNETEASVFLSGNNAFTGNTANGVANDIYNDGTLTIASGMTSIDGGINGAGALDIKSGATLNMNYASIEQGTINIDGTLMASLRDANDTVDIAGTLSGTGNVLLSAGGVGTYDVSLFTDANLNVDFGKTYQTTIVDGVATLGVKDIATISAETGITGGAAGAVSALATSSDAKLQTVSLAIQEALNKGDVALVEKEMAKVNPDTKPVGQSVAASVQGQVVSVAAGRMSAVGGGTMGRAGGDVTGAGFWAQGLVNKSKMGSEFKGETTGFALGGDTLIDNVFTLGAGFAFNDTAVKADGRDTDVESNSVFAYAQYKPSKWFANATISYTLSDYTDDAKMRGGVVINNQYDTKAFGAQAMFGYDFATGISPEAGLRYLSVSQEEHRDGLDRVIKDMNYDVLTGVAGLKYAFAIESDTAIMFSPSLRAAMTYDITTPDAVATIVVPGASAYYVDIDGLSRLGGEFGIGLTAEYRGLEMSLNYELDLHENYTSQTGLFKFRYNF